MLYKEENIKQGQITNETIDEYFAKLSKAYKKHGGKKYPVEIILIGGAAIIANYGFRNSTTDIDAILPSIGILKDAIHEVADESNLPNDWLNDDFTKTSSYSTKIIEYSKPYKTFNQVLNVRMVTGEYLLAMKLHSGRNYKFDLSDIIGILDAQEKNGKPITYEDINKAVLDLYGGWESIPKDASDFLTDVLKKKEYEKEYPLIREKEEETKRFLIDFEKKYPKVLTNQNIKEISKKAENQNDKKETLIEKLEELKKLQKTNLQSPERIPKVPER